LHYILQTAKAKQELEIMTITTTYTKQYQPTGGKPQGQLDMRCYKDTDW